MALTLNVGLGNFNQIKKKFEQVKVGGNKAQGSGPSAGATGGGLKSLLLLGGIFGAIVTLVSSVESITTLLSVVGALINQLVAPLVPILLGLLKPVLIGLQMLIGFMLKFFQDPVSALNGLFDDIGKVVGGLLGMNPQEISAFVQNLKETLTVIIGVFQNALGFLVAFFQGDFEAALGFLGKILIGLWELMKLSLQRVLLLLPKILMGLWNLLLKVGAMQVKILGNIFTSLWNFLKGIFIGAWNILKGIWESLINSLSSIFNSVITFFDNVFRRFGQAFIDGINFLIGLLNRIPGVSLSSVGGSAGGLQSRQLNTNIVINVEGSADQNTVDAVITRLRGEINRRGAF